MSSEIDFFSSFILFLFYCFGLRISYTHSYVMLWDSNLRSLICKSKSYPLAISAFLGGVGYIVLGGSEMGWAHSIFFNLNFLKKTIF